MTTHNQHSHTLTKTALKATSSPTLSHPYNHLQPNLFHQQPTITKMFYSTLAVLLLSASSALAAPAVEVDARADACPIAQNFGFEDGLANWRTNTQGGAIKVDVVSSGARSGSKAV